MSELRVNAIRHTGASSDAITLASDGTATAKISNYPRYNLLINGTFAISQRQGTTGGNPTNGIYWIDRWKAGLSQSAKYGLQQKTSTPASGFKEYLSIASNSAYTLTTNDHFFIEQCIEGVNAAPLDYGLSTAKTSTLSFWVRSTLTGTFGGAFSNNAGDRSYVFAYTISTANTWEKKSVTIAGDTSGTWLRNNGIGLKVRFNLGVNGTWSATAGSWGAGNKAGNASQVALVGTNNAELLLAGVKLEIGDTATEFVTSYGDELLRCQRYYYVHADGDDKPIGTGTYYNSAQNYVNLSFPTTMRDTPTIVQNTGTDYYTAFANSASDNFDDFDSIWRADLTTAVIVNYNDTSMTAGSSAMVRTNNASAKVAFSAEI